MKLKALLMALTISLGVSGCSYFDDKMVEEVRNQLKTTDKFDFDQKDQATLDLLKQMGIKVDVSNEYPTFTWTMRFSTINKDEIPAGEMTAFSSQIEDEICKSLLAFNQGTDKERQIIARVLEEDNVALKLIMKDKIGREISSGSKVLSTCPEFSSLKNS